MKLARWLQFDRLKYIIAFGALAWSISWYSGLDAPTEEHVSIFVFCSYFAVASSLYLLFWASKRFVKACTGPLQRHARVFLYGRGTHGSIGNALDFTIMGLSVGACVMYILETYKPSLAGEASWQFVEMVIAVVFAVDYFVRMFLALDVLDYIFSSSGIINLVTFLPVLVYTWFHFMPIRNGQDENTDTNTKLTYLRLLRLSKVLRILRAFNLVQSRPNDNLKRELFSLIFTVLCIILSAAAVYQWLENDDSCFDSTISNTFTELGYKDPGAVSERGCVHFHEALYWCTIETLGRPRLIMEEDSTIFMLIALVTLSVLLIPRQLAMVISVMQSTSKFQRAEYRRSGYTTKHLVVVGHCDFASVNMLLYEFFHPDREKTPVRDVVLLFPGKPNQDMEWLLAHPEYVGHVAYLQGSPLQENDLERASLATAAGVVVLTNKDSDQPRWHDGELLTCIQSMKAYWLKDIVQMQRRRHFTSSREAATKFLRPRIVAQVLLPETKEYLMTLPGWTDRDVVVVCSEYVASMLAMATLARGMGTLVFNLMSHMEKQRFYRTKWYPRYEAGATQEIYSVYVREKGILTGLTLQEAATILLKDSCILVAVERLPKQDMEDTGCEIMEGLYLFPGLEGFRLQAKDRLFCITRSHKELRDIMTKAGAEERNSFGSNVSSVQLVCPMSPMGSRTRNRGPRLSGASDESDTVERDSSRQLDVEVELISSPTTAFDGPEASAEPAPPRTPSPRTPVFPNRMRKVSSSSNANDKEDVIRKLMAHEPRWTGHVVLCGLPQTQAGRPGGRGLVTSFIETLDRSAAVGVDATDLVGIFVIDEDAVSKIAALCEVEPVIMDMACGGRLRAKSADPRHRDSLIQDARVHAARAVVGLPEHVTQNLRVQLSTVGCQEGLSQQKMVKQIIDTNTVLTIEASRHCADLQRNLHCVTLLLQESTNSLFFGQAQMRHAGAAASADRWMDIAPLNMSPLFASGELLAMTCFDRLVVEALFTPQVVPLINLFLFGDDNGNQIYQMACPDEYVDSSYRTALHQEMAEGRALIGLLRFPTYGSSFGNTEELDLLDNPDLPDASLPYVMTNPDPDSVVMRKSDLLFVLGERVKKQNCDVIAKSNPSNGDETDCCLIEKLKPLRSEVVQANVDTSVFSRRSASIEL